MATYIPADDSWSKAADRMMQLAMMIGNKKEARKDRLQAQRLQAMNIQAQKDLQKDHLKAMAEEGRRQSDVAAKSNESVVLGIRSQAENAAQASETQKLIALMQVKANNENARTNQQLARAQITAMEDKTAFEKNKMVFDANQTIFSTMKDVDAATAPGQKKDMTPVILAAQMKASAVAQAGGDPMQSIKNDMELIKSWGSIVKPPTEQQQIAENQISAQKEISKTGIEAQKSMNKANLLSKSADDLVALRTTAAAAFKVLQVDPTNAAALEEIKNYQEQIQSFTKSTNLLMQSYLKELGIDENAPTASDDAIEEARKAALSSSAKEESKPIASSIRDTLNNLEKKQGISSYLNPYSNMWRATKWMTGE